MNESEQLHTPQESGTKQSDDSNNKSTAPTKGLVSTPHIKMEVGNPFGLFSLRHPKVLLKAIAVLLGIGLVFYAGYVFAIYQVDDTGGFSLPHYNFNSANDPECVNPCEFEGSIPADQSELPSNCSQQQIDDTVCGAADKPVIYLYPSHTEEINVKLLYSPGFSKTVPEYNESTGWQVLARPDGTLTNLADSKTYPYLFWEGKPDPSLQIDMSTGFVVAGSNTNNFLRRQLNLMGLNQREVAAFIAYWLPKMESNPYNLIHFAGSEYTNAARLTISPKPNSLLRVFMAFRPLHSPVKVIPQTFPAFHRTGFTAVEWGGTELGD